MAQISSLSLCFFCLQLFSYSLFFFLIVSRLQHRNRIARNLKVEISLQLLTPSIGMVLVLKEFAYAYAKRVLE
ncbi:hypothetical protein LY78DRAFT_87661 [Colletotrichum sublineola]|nr:hypothetical protein LY78DRAFT_87661 [Colletotrichum sublineola]